MSAFYSLSGDRGNEVAANGRVMFADVRLLGRCRPIFYSFEPISVSTTLLCKSRQRL